MEEDIKNKKEEIVKLDGKKYKKRAFMIEENHPMIGRILIIDGEKYKVMSDSPGGHNRVGTFIARMDERDEEAMEEYDNALEELSEKLANKVDVKRLIKENIKTKQIDEIKTGLFILKAQEDGEAVEEEHHKGCYNYKLHYKNHTFDFISGDDVAHGVIF